MKSFLESLSLSALAVFAPIKPVLLTVLVLVILDFVTGVYAATKQKLPVTSAGFKRTVGKLLMYEFAICVAFLVHQYLTGDMLPAEKLIAGMVGLTELKSILENLDIISGQNFFELILARITQKEKDAGK